VTYHFLNLIASTYGSGSYNSSTYNGQSTGSGSLTDTGIAITSIVTAAVVILLLAIVVRIWKRPAKAVLEPVRTDETNQDVNQ
jgi:hypothetical protein